jgi:hypothetical protein
MAIPLADITEEATPHTNALKTGGLVVGTVALAAGIGLLVWLATYEDPS